MDRRTFLASLLAVPAAKLLPAPIPSGEITGPVYPDGGNQDTMSQVFMDRRRGGSVTVISVYQREGDKFKLIREYTNPGNVPVEVIPGDAFFWMPPTVPWKTA